MRRAFAFALLVLTVGVNLASLAQDKPPKPVLHEDLIRAAAVPEGYTLTVHEIKMGEEVAGTTLLCSRATPGAAVTINIENRKLPTERHRIAAAKGYINGTARSLGGAGFNLVDKDLPDTEKLDTSKPILAGLTYQDSQGRPMHVKMRIFFANERGYSCQVMARDETDLKTLWDWATTIEAK